MNVTAMEIQKTPIKMYVKTTFIMENNLFSVNLPISFHVIRLATSLQEPRTPISTYQKIQPSYQNSQVICTYTLHLERF